MSSTKSKAWAGDTNLDGRFNSTDLILIFQAGEYEDEIEENSTWSRGDWNGDRDFTTLDLIFAFQHGKYVAEATDASPIDIDEVDE